MTETKCLPIRPCSFSTDIFPLYGVMVQRKPRYGQFIGLSVFLSLIFRILTSPLFLLALCFNVMQGKVIIMVLQSHSFGEDEKSCK